MGAASAQTLQPQQLCASGPVLHFGHDTFAAPWLGFHLWDLLEVWGHWGGVFLESPSVAAAGR